MRKLTFGILACLLILVTVPARAGMGSFILGYSLGNSGSRTVYQNGTVTSGAAGDVIYAMPRASERIRNPLAIRFYTVYCGPRDKAYELTCQYGEAISEIYKKIPGYGRFGLVQVVLRPHPSNDASYLTFFYTDWKNLKKAEELPKQK
jgi:hypothetical protein